MSWNLQKNLKMCILWNKNCFPLNPNWVFAEVFIAEISAVCDELNLICVKSMSKTDVLKKYSFLIFFFYRSGNYKLSFCVINIHFLESWIMCFGSPSLFSSESFSTAGGSCLQGKAQIKKKNSSPLAQLHTRWWSIKQLKLIILLLGVGGNKS